MYQRIREEGLEHSHVMEFASGLMDGIGARLTGSPNLQRANEWTRDQFTAMGCSNAHLEDWGQFGMGWQQLNTWVRMTVPDTYVFIAQAAPWSPSTNGAITAPAVWANMKEEKDFDKYKGKLAGKIVFLGEMRPVKPVDKGLFVRLEENDLKRISEFPLKPTPDRFAEYLKKLEFREKVGKFLASEKALAVIVPSRDGRNGGGSGGTIRSSAVRIPRLSARAAPTGSSSCAHRRAAGAAVRGRPGTRPFGRVRPHPAASPRPPRHRAHHGGYRHPRRAHRPAPRGQAQRPESPAHLAKGWRCSWGRHTKERA